MAISESDERFLHSTRGKILTLLRRKEHTVHDLAEALGLTDNGVRAHLTTLERDGFVQAVSSRRSTRKPARVYSLVAEAEQRLSVAYPPFAAELCGVLARTVSKADRVATMREVGSRLAGGRRIPPGPGETRVRTAADALEELGGACDVTTIGPKISIEGHGCPLGVVTGAYPEACLAVESMLSTMLGAEVRERCIRAGRPRCRFDIDAEVTGPRDR